MAGPSVTSGKRRASTDLLTRHPGLLLAGGVGLFALGWLAVALAPREAKPRTPASAPGSGALAAKGSGAPAAEPDLSFAQFMRILGAEAERPAARPVARAFAKAFAEEPKLSRVYADFRRREAAGEKPSAKAFFAAVRSSPAFRGFMSRFAGNPGAQAAVAAIARQPELRRLFGQLDRMLPRAAEVARGSRNPGSPGLSQSAGPGLAFASAAGGGPPGAGGPSAIAGGGVGNFGSGPGPSAGARRGAGAKGGSFAREHDGSRAGAEGDGAGKPAEKTPGASGEREREDAPGSAAPGAGTFFDDLTDPQSERMKRLLEAYPWLNGMGEADVWRLITTDAIDRNGLWGGCFSLGLYAKCREACDGSGGSCEPMAGWDACKEWTTAQACVPRCQALGASCVVPPEFLPKPPPPPPPPAIVSSPRPAANETAPSGAPKATVPTEAGGETAPSEESSSPPAPPTPTGPSEPVGTAIVATPVVQTDPWDAIEAIRTRRSNQERCGRDDCSQPAPPPPTPSWAPVPPALEPVTPPQPPPPSCLFKIPGFVPIVGGLGVWCH